MAEEEEANGVMFVIAVDTVDDDQIDHILEKLTTTISSAAGMHTWSLDVTDAVLTFDDDYDGDAEALAQTVTAGVEAP